MGVTMPKRSTLEDFVVKSRNVHGEKYDYSRVVYTNNRTKVCIVCPEHGEFIITPDKHISGRGCPICTAQDVHKARRRTSDDFISLACNVHGNKYDYSKVDYQGNKVKVCITCPKHGDFWQVPNSHLSGRGCPVCGRIQTNNSTTYFCVKFIEKARAKHGEKYDYSLVEYTSSSSKVKIVCPEHGVFEQTPAMHLFGNGCPKCGRAKANSYKTTSTFIKDAQSIHGNKYDYSKTQYTSVFDSLIIICPKHGEFKQTPNSHLHGHGCPLCGKEKCSDVNKSNTVKFIKKAKAKHGDRYDYSLVEYHNSQEPVRIVCKKHGVFEQIAHNHIQGANCPECIKEFLSNLRLKKKEDFVTEAIAVHGDKYDYSRVEYRGNKALVEIICPKHGSFFQSPNNHVSKNNGCPRCSHHISKGEQEMMDWIKQYFPDACHATGILAGKDIDIYIPSKKFGIEYNGIYFHSTQFKDKYEHLRKLETAQQLGIRLVQFWDSEWESKKDIVKSIILNALGTRSNVVYARNTELRKLTSKEARQFCTENHIHGFRAANNYLGLVTEGNLLAMMSWDTDGEMVRFVVKCGYSVLGAFSKLLKYSGVTYSFVDRRIFTGAGYLKNGFSLQKTTQPNYFYENNGQYAGSRQMYQKHKLQNILQEYNPNLTEMQNMANNDYYPVYDCGNWLLTRS